MMLVDVYVCLMITHIFFSLTFCQIGDFGLSRDLVDEQLYFSSGGKVPIRWTAPEVHFGECSRHFILICFWFWPLLLWFFSLLLLLLLLRLL